ncbi:hypothetical protein HQ35_08270 [Porphyromonas cangingivalis]|uniref:Uroporphyrinogen-III synthase n=1 Tax=Porphyromonas cangingivalis TaxID=36874 RepID=A0A0A2EP83_PORCN|nr:uroporphyrinogen-III synthase [Porphyromonas cangingivalis]KGN79285.1 hypothetical protein HQ35_08270 [Porphyromonas cangingivalis]
MKFGIIGREQEMARDIVEGIKSIVSDIELSCMAPIITRPCEVDKGAFGREGELCFIFTSPRGARHFIDRFGLPEGKTVAIGLSTERLLESEGVRVWFRPSIETSQGLAAELLPLLKKYDAENDIRTTLVQPTSDIAGLYLKEYFQTNGFDYHLAPIYETVLNPLFSKMLQGLSRCPDFFVFYSPSGVTSWIEAIKNAPWVVGNTFLAISIGPKTTEKLEQYGYKNISEAASPHPEDVVRVVVDSIKRE